MAVPPHQRTGSQARPGDTLVVIHDFNARSSDELTLRKSERVELIELDEGFGDGWYLGRHLSRGGTGLFPGVYTTKVPSAVRSMQAPLVNRAPASPPLLQSTGTESATSSGNNLNVLTPYQHAESPLPTPTNEVPPMIKTYSPAFSYDLARGSHSSTYSSYVPGLQRSIGQALDNGRGGEDSPVMHETLSVIDEHITDLTTPSHNLAPPQPIREDSESDYSSNRDRQSFVAGPETDDEENGAPSEAEVRKWDHQKTAQHLREIGVDPKHCDIFEEQEISGDVLMDMDQGFIYMKEYNFGVMGRRLKTWHKIRDFQNDVKRRRPSHQGTIASLDTANSPDDAIARSQSRIASGGTILPRIPSLREKPGLNVRQSQTGTPMSEDGGITAPLQTQGYARTGSMSNPPSPWRTSMASESPSRPSAAMVRELSHSRRHSSIDFGSQPSLELSATPLNSSSIAHKKQVSLDRDWSLSSSTAVNTTSPPSVIRKQESMDLAASPPPSETLQTEHERGYFSGNELENRKQRNILRKKDSGESRAVHSRQSSANAIAAKRHSRLSSVDSIRELGSSLVSPASKAYNASTSKNRFRSASARGPAKSLPPGTSPAVTNLEDEFSGRASTGGSHAKFAMPNKARKLMGFRSSSETVGGEKTTQQTDVLEESSKASPVQSPTGSTTPSGTSRSFDLDNNESSNKLATLAGMSVNTRQTTRTKPKIKQETSAYTRGLLKISPKEAREHCDYHGWMKKKSSSLTTTWKPRLFILRGRRMSYYYSEDDVEERGIIDISGHKVLVANSDSMVTFHAQITGATSTASPPASNLSSNEVSPNPARNAEPSPGSRFYFKLVPPKSGLSRAVQFTKPMVHYFQVDSVVEGRKWMGEIMKATIEHDLSTFETTNKQATISLAKARARKERPPALKDTERFEDPSAEKENLGQTGLNIQGLTLNDPPTSPTYTGEKDETNRHSLNGVTGNASKTSFG